MSDEQPTEQASDTQTEVEFLTQELKSVREQLADAQVKFYGSERQYQSLAEICDQYHALLFGNQAVPPKDPNRLMRAVALGYAADMQKRGVRNFVTQDTITAEAPGYDEPFRLNVTIQRVEGKTPAQVFGEFKDAMTAMEAVIGFFEPALAETIALSQPEEVPAVIEKWQKSAAIACPVDSTSYTQSHT